MRHDTPYSSLISITELQPSEIPQAAKLIARAMANNPLHLAIFGKADHKVISRQEKMFLLALQLPGLKIYASRQDGQINGIMCYTTSAHCQLKPLQLFKAIPPMIKALGSRLVPVLLWRMNWGRHDPKGVHYHFGPLAVDPDYQGKGIGKALLQYFCTLIEGTIRPAYLETDKEINIKLYEKFGFRIVAKDSLFGVSNWFMQKHPS